MLKVSGCDADHYKPLNINGWFWASTLVKVPETDFESIAIITVMMLIMVVVLIHVIIGKLIF